MAERLTNADRELIRRIPAERTFSEAELRQASRLSRLGLCRVKPVTRYAARVELTEAGWKIYRGEDSCSR